ncbi:Pollen allergen ole e 1 family [Thalictrum thalictroides]|uniref:Pollen allergen ole e 1 family n=1 Tax=Thalictrum thalictroides TaxID=46969 RepID=A0A7J6X8U6_THATH|nr:Pollen allergen ole e 1 family [Thalictrum thalictroides]
MAKLVALVASLCFLSFLGAAYCKIEVRGLIYCDTCRVLFPTIVAKPATDAQVTLVCRDRENEKNVTVSITTSAIDEHGKYVFEVDGDHEDEICEVRLEKNNDPDCTQIIPGLDRARILISDNSGIASNVRYANPLGFIKSEALPECAQILRSYDLLPSAHI